MRPITPPNVCSVQVSEDLAYIADLITERVTNDRIDHVTVFDEGLGKLGVFSAYALGYNDNILATVQFAATHIDAAATALLDVCSVRSIK